MIEKHPFDLIENRFDIKVKYLYARSLETNHNEDLYKFFYEYHLQKWNNFKEQSDNFKNDKKFIKNSFEDFDISFKNLLLSVKNNTFNFEESLVPIIGNYPINGAHRIAACLLYNRTVICKQLSTVKKPKHYNELFFISKGVSKNYISFINQEFQKYFV